MKTRLRDNLWTIIFFLLLFILAVMILVLIYSVQEQNQPEQTAVGGVFIGSVADDGWNQNHYEGLKEACDGLGLSLETAEYVSETSKECRIAVDGLVKKGCRVIFLTSDGFGSNVADVIEDYPDIVFYTISPEASAKNITTYYGRMYQVRYLAGILAGSMTETNVLGFVAAMRNVQVDRDINAYTLGARQVNPDAVVKVRLTGSWFDGQKEREAANALIDEDGADVLTYHSSTADTIGVAEKRGVYSIGYSRMGEHYSDRYLTAVVFHWDVLYEAILQDYLKGSIGKTTPYWWGVTEGAVGIDRFSPLVDEQIIGKLRDVRSGFEEGQDVFLGQIRRDDGKVMCRKDERMSDQALLFDMKWFVEGVEINAD